jgi:hypothetical protein
MLAVCHFYGWTLADVRAMTLRDFDAACDFLIEYKKREAEAYK